MAKAREALALKEGEVLFGSQFLDRILGTDFRTHSGVIHKHPFCWKAASGI